MQMTEGRYRYRLNGEPAPVEETWTISGAANSRQRVESTRKAGNVSLKVSAILERGDAEFCEITWQSVAAPLVEARYERGVTGIHWRRTVGERVTEGVVDEAEGGRITLYPLMRVFTGGVISGLAALDGEAQVLVPNIASDDELVLLLPDLSLRRVVCEGKDTLEDFRGVPCERWSFIGGQYDETAKFWLDTQGLLLRYRWRQSAGQLWEVELER